MHIFIIQIQFLMLTSFFPAVTIGPNKRTVITIVCDDDMLRNLTNVKKLTEHYLKRMIYGADTWLGQVKYFRQITANTKSYSRYALTFNLKSNTCAF